MGTTALVESSTANVGAARRLVFVLRLFGVVDLLALAAVIMPVSWLATAHAEAGLGSWPEGPVVVYLARSASALYAFHGALIVFVSFDVARYERLIVFLAVMAVIHGLTIVVIDELVGMPWWWTLLEGPSYASGGALILLLQLGRKGQHPSVTQGQPAADESQRLR